MDSDSSVHFALLASLRERGISLPNWAIILVPTVLIVISEALLFFGYATYSLGAHLVTLLVCTLAPLRFKDDASLFQVFALVPLFRLVNLGMPIFFKLTLFWYPLIYGPLIPAVYYVARNQSPVSLSAGWRITLLSLPVTIPASGVLGAIEYSIIQPEALIPEWSLPQLLLLAIIQFGFIGFVEELLYRATLQRLLKKRLGMWPAVLLASVLFGMMHSPYQAPLELVFAGGIGFLYGLVYERTDSLLLVTVLHGALNTFLFGIIPMHPSLFPLS